MTIPNLQTAGAAAASTAPTLTSAGIGVDKICGISWNADITMTGAAAATAAYQLTACSFQTPFRVGVHFDGTEAIGAPAAPTSGDDAANAIENAFSTAWQTGEGRGYNGFWLAYWQNTC